MERNFTISLLSIFCLCFFVQPSKAQRGVWADSKDFIGTETAWDMHFSRDQQTVYVLGSGAVPAGPSGSPGPYSFFIGKYDTAGVLISTIMPKTLGSGYDNEAYSMAIDKNKNMYVTGYFSTSIQIDNIKMKGNGGVGADYFLARLNANDSCVWIKGLSTSSGNSITGMRLDVDDSGYVYVVGAYGGQIKLGSYTFKSPSGNRSTFFAKYDSTGKVIWASSFGSYTAGYMEGTYSLLVEKNTTTPAVYLAGQFYNKQTYGGTVFKSAGQLDIILLKYDAFGKLQKAVSYGDKYMDMPNYLTMTPNNRLLLTGSFISSTNLGGTALTGHGSQDIFTAMLDTDLSIRWAQSCGGSNYEIPGMAAASPKGDVYLTGQMRSGPTYFGKDTISLSDFSNAFIAKYDSTGKFLGAVPSTGSRISTSYLSYQGGVGILIDTLADIYLSGMFSGNAVFGDSNVVLHSNTAKATDVFTVKVKDTIQNCRYFRKKLFMQNNKCFGDALGYAKVTASGGQQPYSYTWKHSSSLTSDSAGGLQAGNYPFIITDYIGCRLKDTSRITSPSQLVARYTATPARCHGDATGAIRLNVSGGTGAYLYKWMFSNALHGDSITAVPAGRYVFRVTDSLGCSMQDTAVINEPAAIKLSANITNANSGNDGAIQLTVNGGTTPYSYLWSNGAITQDIDSIPAGKYYVTVTDSHACMQSDTFTVSFATGVAAASSVDMKLKLFPNPVEEKVFIELPEFSSRDILKIYSADGKCVYREEISANKNSIQLDVKAWKEGVYLIRLEGSGYKAVLVKR